MEKREDEKIISRYMEIQEEILKIGWNGILDKYHPDMNCDDPDAETVFKLYKGIYQDIKKRLTIQQ